MEGLDEDTRKGRETLTAVQYGGIYPPHEAFYIQSIIYAEPAFALMAERGTGRYVGSAFITLNREMRERFTCGRGV
ncbi:hypothetical protein NKI63_05975 [Mesorhizobium sp. M0410]|uniref:hypothetical protein n=1 Tax=Mesorhizobium sp. M0410 TaxID=2956943 RepID=UPI00333A8863